MRLFAALPYGEVQMDAVAQEAGVAKPTLYRYFATKELLFLTALDSFLSEFVGAIEAIAYGAAAPDVALTEILSVSFEKFAGSSAALRAADGSESGVGGQGRRLARERIDKVRGAIAAVLRRGTQSGEFSDEDPDTTALILLGAVRIAGVRTPVHRREQVLNHIRNVVMNGVARGDRFQANFAAAPSQELEPI